MPVDPHGRDRSRLQEAVARACLDSDMVDQAAELADQMQGWRRGHVIALCGQYFARRGQTDSARDCADRALLVDVGDTTWGKDVVVTEVAKIYVLLGDESRAYSLVAVGQPTERGQVETARTAQVPMDQMDGQADMFDQAIATGNFDLARGGIDGYLVWLDRVIDDAPRRARALSALSGAFPGLPLDLQVRYRVQLAEVLYSRGYKELAKTEVDCASALFKATVFLPEDTAPLGAVIAKARFRMGDADSARSELRALRAAYNAQSDLIVNLRRAASLRALAEGFLLLGDSDDAVESYKAALDAGAINPNARPRAEDLSATCVSMAMSGFQPSPEFMLRIDNLRAGLVDPW
jgi:tetratricopeptide (TPR) repeat protein